MHNLSTSSFKRLPWGLLWGVLLVGLVQFACLHSRALWSFLYLYSYPLNDDPLRFEAAIRLAQPVAGQRRVLITGSSQAREDVDVEALNAYFAPEGLSFMNLGVSGGGPPMDMYMLMDRLIQQHPALVVYIPYFGSFFQPKYNYLKFRYYFHPRILSPLRRTVGLRDLWEQKSVLADLLARRVFYLYRYRESFQRITNHFLERVVSGKPLQKPLLYALSEGKPRSSLEEEVTHRTHPWYAKTQYFELNKELFAAFARALREAGIPLWVIDGPTHPLLHQTYEGDRQGEYQRFLENTSRRIGFRFIDHAQLPTFPESAFGDLTHLNARGRARFTAFLEQEIARWSPPAGPKPAPGRKRR